MKQVGPASLLRPPDGVNRHYFSSRGLADDKSQGWRTIVNDIYAPLDIDIVNPSTFYGEIHRSAISRLELSEFVTDGETAHRKRAHIAVDDEDFFLLELAKSGTSTYRQYERDCELKPAHFMLLYSADPYFFGHDERVSSLCLKVPAVAMRSRLADPHMLCGVARPVVPGLSRIMADMLISLSGEASLLDSASAPVMEANLLDMIGLVLGGRGERAAVNGTTARWAIHKRTTAFMQEALGQADLSPDVIATAMGVSVRYLHRVFEDAQQTVGETLMALRLGKSMNELRDPGLRPQSIKEIAFRNGFRSQSHFASAFKAKFGVTPKEARSMALTEASC